MPAIKDQILELAKDLPDDERWELIEDLTAMFDSRESQPILSRDEYRDLIGRRSAELDAGTVQAIPAAEVLAEMKHRLGIPQND